MSVLLLQANQHLDDVFLEVTGYRLEGSEDAVEETPAPTRGRGKIMESNRSFSYPATDFNKEISYYVLSVDRWQNFLIFLSLHFSCLSMTVH